jgi:hypothetical protein
VLGARTWVSAGHLVGHRLVTNRATLEHAARPISLLSGLTNLMFLSLFHALPMIVGLVLTILVLCSLVLWLEVMINKERKGIGRQFRNSGLSNRKQRRMEQAMNRQKRKPR